MSPEDPPGPGARAPIGEADLVGGDQGFLVGQAAGSRLSQVEILGEEAEQTQVLEKSQDSEMSWFCRPLRTLTHKQL